MPMIAIGSCAPSVRAPTLVGAVAMRGASAVSSPARCFAANSIVGYSYASVGESSRPSQAARAAVSRIA